MLSTRTPISPGDMIPGGCAWQSGPLSAQPAKNSPAAACRSAGAGHCLVLALDLSWLLVVMSACFYPLRRASKSVRPECIWGAISPILLAFP